jgi:hypothetical protein
MRVIFWLCRRLAFFGSGFPDQLVPFWFLFEHVILNIQNQDKKSGIKYDNNRYVN